MHQVAQNSLRANGSIAIRRRYPEGLYTYKKADKSDYWGIVYVLDNEGKTGYKMVLELRFNISQAYEVW